MSVCQAVKSDPTTVNELLLDTQTLSSISVLLLIPQACPRSQRLCIVIFLCTAARCKHELFLYTNHTHWLSVAALIYLYKILSK